MKKSLSLLRRLEYEELSKISLSGKILDLGGAKKSGYHELIKGNRKIEAANIDQSCEPDLNIDLEDKFPLKDSEYDGIICLNVLEHIFNYQNIFNESFRILKDGGLFIGATPFLFNVHGSPNDYFRYTKSPLEKLFIQAGFGKVDVKELGSGVFSVIYQLKFGLYRIDFIRSFFMKYNIALDKILKFIKPNNFTSEKYMPIGYFFIAKK